MALALPHTFHDGAGEIASGRQVMENLTVLKEVLDVLYRASTTAHSIEAFAFTLGTEYEPQTTGFDANRPHEVRLAVGNGAVGGAPVKIKAVVGGVALPELIETNVTGGVWTRALVYGPFMVGAGLKWKAEGTNVTAAPTYAGLIAWVTRL